MEQDPELWWALTPKHQELTVAFSLFLRATTLALEEIDQLPPPERTAEFVLHQVRTHIQASLDEREVPAAARSLLEAAMRHLPAHLRDE